MPDFTRRSTVPELMDTERVDYADFRRCLAHLMVVNHLTLAYRPTFGWLDGMVMHNRGRALSIVDVGSGYGDMLRKIARWAVRRGVRVRLTGVDLNPWSERAAREATPEGMAIDYVTADLFDFHPQEPPDIILSSLFAHHLPDDALVRFLQWMDGTARLGWFVNDLRRSAAAYRLFGAGMAIGPWHRFIRHDGLISISRAFHEADWERLVASAGIARERVVVKRRFPFRLCAGAFTGG